MKIMRIAVFALLTFGIVACGSTTKDTDYFVVEEPADKPAVKNQLDIDRNWRVNLGGRIDLGDAILSPFLSGAHVYAASTNGRIEKIDASNGNRVWQTDLDDTSITAGVTVGSGLLLAGTDDGIVYAVNVDDGSVDWQTKLTSEILASPVVGDSKVVARSIDGKVYGLELFGGEIAWTISRELPRLTLRGDSKPLVIQGIVITGFPDGVLAAVDETNGRALWDFPISFAQGNNEIDRLADIDTTPLLVGNNVYVSSYQGLTHALNIPEQRIEWSAEVSSIHSFSFDAAHLYVSDEEGVVHQIDRDNGEEVWSQRGLRLRNTSAPISVGAYVLVGDGDGSLYAMSKTDGSYVGRFSLGANAIVGEPIVDGNVIYFMDSDGALQSITVSGESS